MKPGDRVGRGDILGTVQETPVVLHKIMVPRKVRHGPRHQAGEFTVTEEIATLEAPEGQTEALTLMQRWPVRKGRPYVQKLSPMCPW